RHDGEGLGGPDGGDVGVELVDGRRGGGHGGGRGGRALEDTEGDGGRWRVDGDGRTVARRSSSVVPDGGENGATAYRTVLHRILRAVPAPPVYLRRFRCSPRPLPRGRLPKRRGACGPPPDAPRSARHDPTRPPRGTPADAHAGCRHPGLRGGAPTQGALRQGPALPRPGGGLRPG